MSDYDFVVNSGVPHVGGNIWQGDPLTYASAVWRYMIDRFAVQSVLDIGSGRGHAAHWFYKAGCKVVAIDAAYVNVQNAIYPTVHHDLTFSALSCPVDLVHCQEVAEHIAPEHVDKLLATMANGDVILMSHAEPGQTGYHHVNLQPAQYWIDAVCGRGYRFLDIDTARVRAYAEAQGAEHLARSGLVFARAMG